MSRPVRIWLVVFDPCTASSGETAVAAPVRGGQDPPAVRNGVRPSSQQPDGRPVEHQLFKRRACAWTALVLVAASHAPASAAAEQLADLSLEDLGNLAITSVSKRPEPLSGAPTSIYVITADEIRRSGAASLPEALRLAPNLHVAQAYEGGYAISARGFNSSSANKLLVLIDGRSVYTPLYAGVFWDVQNPMLEDIERIEVISGPGGTLWGLNAVNGVINVITRPAGQTIGWLATAGAGNRLARAAARQGGSLGDDGSYRLYAQYFNRRHTRTAAGTDVDDAMRMSQAGFRADWSAAGAADRLMLQGEIYRGERGQPLPGAITLTGVRFVLGDIPLAGAHLLSRWERRLDSGAVVSVQGYFDRTERDVRTIFGERLNIADLQFQYASAPHPRHAWVWGAQHRYGKDKVNNETAFFGFLPARVDQKWSSVFAQDEIAVSQRLRLTVGARLERNDYTGTEFLPGARLAWKAADDHLLWAAASRTVRAPSRLDRDIFYPARPRSTPPPFILAGGPDVRSEIAEVFELGWRGRPAPRTSVSATLYRSFYDHLRTQQIAATRNYVFLSNGMQGRVDGIEAWGTWQPLPSWRLQAGLAGLRMKLRLRPGSNDLAALTARSADPALTWTLRSALDLAAGQELELALRHVSTLSSGTPAARVIVPSYTAFDLRWGWRPRSGLELSVAGQNLLGTAHGEFTAAATRTRLGPGVFAKLVSEF